MRLVSVLVAATCVTLCALNAFAEQASSSTSASAPAESASASASAHSASSASAAAGEPALTEREKRVVAHGYKLQMRNGERLFCRRESVLGSRFERLVCGTASDIEARMLADQEDAAKRYNLGTGIH